VQEFGADSLLVIKDDHPRCARNANDCPRSESGQDRPTQLAVAHRRAERRDGRRRISLPVVQAGGAGLALLVRGHWGIENQLTDGGTPPFDEDSSWVRDPRGVRNTATLRNLAIA